MSPFPSPLSTTLSPLPIDPFLPEIAAKLATHSSLVLEAEPGAGKTTRVPPFLLDSKELALPPGQEIWVLEPRRLAAKLSATRVASERGSTLGKEVGYQFRFEKVGGQATRLWFFTEGILLRKRIDDPKLSRAGVVILDEFHERSLHADVALSFLKALQKTVRPDLKILVMSATLETQSLSQFLGGAPVMKIPGRVFPVREEYLPLDPALYLDKKVVKGVERGISLLGSDPGDMLVFLPGMGEIRRAETALIEKFGSQLAVLPLHGELSQEEQSRALGPAPRGLRKVILSTNIAETSLTIPGVRLVIDSGLARVGSVSSWNGLFRLQTQGASRASLTQRKGRAGREAPGFCVKLYSKFEEESRPAFEVPELHRSDLSQTLLELALLGIQARDPASWFELPKKEAVAQAEFVLLGLGALEILEEAQPGAALRLTEKGRALLKQSFIPRLSNLIFEGERLGPEFTSLTFDLAFMISELGFSEWSDEGVLESLKKFQRRLSTDASLRRRYEKMGGGIAHGPTTGGQSDAKGKASGETEERLSRLLLDSFRDRLARKKGKDWVMALGGSAEGSESGPSAHFKDGDFALALDAEEKRMGTTGKGVLRVQTLLGIPEEWIWESDHLLEEKTEWMWEPGRSKLSRKTVLKVGSLVLEESVKLGATEALKTQAADYFVSQVRAGDGFAPGWMDPQDWHRLTSRLNLFLKARKTQLKNPIEYLHEFAEQYAESGLLQAQDFISHLTLGYQNEIPGFQGELDREFPPEVTLARGRKVKVNYESDRGPWIESRLQDFFGMKEGPKLGQGRVPLTLHLLAPNYRAVQVTQDLSSFWKTHYPEVRRELMRRYPRHLWPEDPTVLPSASPSRG